MQSEKELRFHFFSDFPIFSLSAKALHVRGGAVSVCLPPSGGKVLGEGNSSFLKMKIANAITPGRRLDNVIYADSQSKPWEIRGISITWIHFFPLAQSFLKRAVRNLLK